MDIGQFGIPGQSDISSSVQRDILWGGDESRIKVLRTSDRSIVSTAVDAANTPTTVLRAGLLLGLVTSSGKLKEYDPDATDGSQSIYGVLPIELRMTDGLAVAVDRYVPVVVHAPLKASKLLVEGTALVGHADEYNVRRQLAQAGCLLSDDPRGLLAGSFRMAAKTADYTVVAADNGTYFTTLGADDAVNFTLPALKRGLAFEFFAEADQSMTITAPAADTLVVFNDAAATSIAFSTADEKVGAKVKVRANSAGTKWLAEVNLAAETQTPTIA